MYLSEKTLNKEMVKEEINKMINEYEDRIQRTKRNIILYKYILEHVKYKKDGNEFANFKNGFKSNDDEHDALKDIGYEMLNYKICDGFGGSSYNLSIDYYDENHDGKYEGTSIFIFKSAYEEYDKDYDIESYEFVIYCINKELERNEKMLKEYNELNYQEVIRIIMYQTYDFVNDLRNSGIFSYNSSDALKQIGYSFDVLFHRLFE